ncbi:universal stress protein UspA [Marinomonas sp. SBI22]|jgi:universal stress protein A|uniref:universal stress protein n=1 Tax=unclassified Marinomonas TaxID=196814 RepID=UPI0005FA506F|nr:MULTISPECIES: universal stress protein [unclassified Marinomonas]KJZ12437.1 universal stress protein UspA [Marinomonas sp. S3726]KZM45204.1 universal stress protein UspA [Marinomonas sp. SBI22]KZM46902.1 universal stress protein UspA [Marinomonas sp. SBI8L]
MPYQRILLAADLTEENLPVVEKAVRLCTTYNAKLVILHVIESLNYAYGGDVPIDITDIQHQLQTSAQEKLDALCEQITCPIDQAIISQGGIESEIHRVAEENETNLIVVGSHGRHGLALLLGSTANGVLHGAPCDVLAVRVKN